MAKRDYYEVLGLSRRATVEEIKTAFRSKARKLHPDNQDSGDEAAFKELAEAYEVLSDQKRRTQYDQFGHAGVQGFATGFENFDFSSFAGFGIDDLIDAFFGGGLRSGRRGGPEQGAHLRYDLQVEFLEAVFGADKKISIRRAEECETCHGSGAAAGSNVSSCSSCGGMGQVQQVMNSWFGQSVRIIACPTCQGSGHRIEKPCRDCRGEGLIKKNKEFAVKIPAGVESGSRLRLASAGDKGPRGGPYGDVLVYINVRDHELFVRDGLTIHLNQPISFSMAALGGEMKVPTVDGTKLIKIAAGTQSGTMVVLREMGVPRVSNPQKRGDQVVHLTVQTPTRLKDEEHRLFKRLAELRQESLIAEPKAESPTASSTQDNSSTNVQKGKTPKKRSSKSRDSKNGAGPDAVVNEKDDASFFEKIVEVFKPKNGEEEDK